MLPKKNSWRKLLFQISPILIVSVGLHGLALLIPVPDKVPPENPEVALLEPISVTQLPDVTQRPAPAPEPDPLPLPKPEPDSIPNPEVIIQPQTDIAIAEPPAQLEPEPEIEPEPEPEIEIEPEPEPEIEPEPEPEPEPAPEPTTQTRSTEGTSQADYASKLESLIGDYSPDPDNPLPLEIIRTLLNLSFPTDDAYAYCLKTEADEVALSAQAFISVLIAKDDASDSFDWVDGGPITPTGYPIVDQWVDKTLFPGESTASGDVETVKTPKPGNFDIVDWLVNNAEQDLFEENEEEKILSIGVEVALVNNCQPL